MFGFIKRLFGKKGNDKGEGNSVSIPFMITRDIRQQLYDLGWSKYDVDSMSADLANVFVSNGTVKPVIDPAIFELYG